MKREADQSASKQAIWELTSTDHVLAGKIREALRSVEDPELGYNVIELGLIRNADPHDPRGRGHQPYIEDRKSVV